MLFILLFVLAFSLIDIKALPSGVGGINVLSSSRYGINGGSNMTALAGNVTELYVSANGITQTWQGYFGNVSGKIVLGDANNNTFYDWNAANPVGEIYATRSSSTPTWSSIKCANVTNVNAEDAALGTNQSVAADSVNNTFLNTTTFNSFYVGSIYIDSTSGCYATKMYNASQQKSSSDFAEVLLSDNTNLVYTAIIDHGATGFDSRTHDFEMLVGENGHNGDIAVTPYYFYLELG